MDNLMQLCVFIRALALQRDDLNMSIFLVDSSGDSPANVLLGSTLHQCNGSDTSSRKDSDDVCETVIQRLGDIIADTQKNTTNSRASPPPWGSAFVQALCHVKKYTTLQTEQNDIGVETSRILSIATCQDDSSKYLTFMNAIFAAQVCCIFFLFHAMTPHSTYGIAAARWNYYRLLSSRIERFVIVSASLSAHRRIAHETSTAPITLRIPHGTPCFAP